VKLTVQLHMVQRSRVSGVMPPLPHMPLYYLNTKRRFCQRFRGTYCFHLQGNDGDRRL